jgi:hypothetical protein
MTPKELPKAQQIILALHKYVTMEKTAEALEISTTTLWRRFRDPEFQALYRDFNRRVYSHVVGRARYAAPFAAASLVQIFMNKELPAGIRAKAACRVLKSANRFKFEDQQVRVAILMQIRKEETNEDAPEEIGGRTSKFVYSETKAELPEEGTLPKISASAVKIDRFVVALLEHRTLAKAAVECGVSDVTMWRWSRKPEFIEQTQKVISEAYSRANAFLQHAANSAISVLLSLLGDKNSPTAVKIMIAGFLLDLADTGAQQDLQKDLDFLQEAEDENEDEDEDEEAEDEEPENEQEAEDESPSEA